MSALWGRWRESTLPGDPAQGRDLYAAAACSSCHVVAGDGIAFGPDLTQIGLVRGAEHLRESIADPGAVIAARYRTVVVEEPGGAQTIGIRVNEDTFTIQVLDEAGRHVSFRKSEVEEYKELRRA